MRSILMSERDPLQKRYSDAILEATRTPKSASEISQEHQIPLTTVYRRIRELRRRNMIGTASCDIRNGRKNFLYKNKIN